MSSAILQISDTHFGTEIPGVVAALRALTRAVAPELVVLSGDVTQRARRGQFAAARRFLDSLGVERVISVPGNHDIPLFALATRCLAPYRHWERSLGADLEPVFESERLQVQCVNTTRWFRHKHGQISPAQIERVARRIARASERQLRIVVAHHPLLAIRVSDHRNLLRGRAEAAQAWLAAGADIVMGGHIHLPYIRPLHVDTEHPAQRTWVVQAGTAVSRRTRDGVSNSVNVLHYADSGSASCSVERWDYRARSGRFERAHSAPLALTRAPAGLPDPLRRAGYS